MLSFSGFRIAKLTKTINHQHSKDVSARLKHIFCIRHTQSIFNAKCHKYPETQIYGPQAMKQFHFDPALIDCGITPEGIAQLQLLSKEVQPQIMRDLPKQEESSITIFVSPLNRALITANTILHSGEDIRKRAKVIVLPLMTEIVSKICDLSGDVEEKMQRYPQFDFSEFNNWAIQNDLSADLSDWQDPLIKSEYQRQINRQRRFGQRYLNILHEQFPEKLQDPEKCLKRSALSFKRAKQIQSQRNSSTIIFVAHNATLKNLEKCLTGKQPKDYGNLEIRKLIFRQKS